MERAAGGETGPEVLGIFQETAKVSLYRENAFRVLGLGVEAKTLESSRRFRELEMQEKFNRVDRPADMPLPLAPAPDGDAIRQAWQRLNDPERRLIDEFFWFWPSHPGGQDADPALAALARGELQEAVNRWEGGKNGGGNAAVAWHNLAVLAHARALDLENVAGSQTSGPHRQRLCNAQWTEAFRNWQGVLEQETLWNNVADRIRNLQDPRLTTGMARRMQTSLPLALMFINAQLALKAADQGDVAEAQRQLGIMKASGLPEKARVAALQLVVAPIRDRIKILCKAAEKETEGDLESGNQVARRLLEQGSPLLAVLDALLTPDDHTRAGAHDELSLAILACGVQYGNHTNKWKDLLDVLQQVLPLAVGEAARQRVEKNIDTVTNNLESECCWFCGERPFEDKASLKVKMHGDIKRQHLGTAIRTTWSWATLTVPRCSFCQTAHKRRGNRTALGVFLGLASGIAAWIGIVQFGKGYGGLGFFAFLAFTVNGIIHGYQSGRKGNEGIKPLTAQNSFPAILKRKAEGWAFGEKPQ